MDIAYPSLQHGIDAPIYIQLLQCLTLPDCTTLLANISARRRGCQAVDTGWWGKMNNGLVSSDGLLERIIMPSMSRAAIM